MCGFLLRIVINTVLIVMVVFELPGIFVDTFGGTLLGSAIIGFANAAIRPMLSAFSAPLDSVTLGSFTFVTNIFAPLAVVVALPGFKISGVFSPVIGIVVLTVWSVMLTKTIHDR